MNFVPCLAWVKKGAAKGNPDKVQLTVDELKRLINETKEDIRESNGGTFDSDEEDETASSSISMDKGFKDKFNAMHESTENQLNVRMEAAASDLSSSVRTNQEVDSLNDGSDDDVLKKYNLDKYDEEDDNTRAVHSLMGLSVFASNDDDPYITLKDETNDSDNEDFCIKPADNLLAVGHVEEDCSILELYVYNDDETFYVHHDIVLPAYPLAMEWLDYDPTDDKPGNYLAVGDMTPVISIWDLDIVDVLEPAYRLGRKKRKKKKIKKGKVTEGLHGHADAVLDLSWNKDVRNVLASASADKTVLVWDLSKGCPVTSVGNFSDKVQTLQWHPVESQTLLAGSCDGTIQFCDCSNSESRKVWTVEGEVEKVLWNHFDPFCFMASTDKGFVYYFDSRCDKSLYTLRAHSEAVTGMCLSSQCPGCLMTASTDQTLKVWDITEGTPTFVAENSINLGALYCLKSCPDLPFTIAVGGDNRSHNLKVWDAWQNASVARRFGSRNLPQSVAGRPQENTMDTDDAAVGVGNLTLMPTASRPSHVHKTKRNKQFSNKRR